MNSQSHSYRSSHQSGFAGLPALVLGLLAALVLADGWLGVYLDADSKSPSIAEVIPGSPADKAGLRVGDIIQQVADQAVADNQAVIAAVRKQRPGEQVRLQLLREGKSMQVVVRLGSRPEENQAPRARPPGRGTTPRRPGAPGPESTPVESRDVRGHAGERQREVEPAPKITPAPEPGKPAGQDPKPDRGRGFLGVGLVEARDGVTVSRVLDGSPAARVGILKGEQLVQIGSAAVRNLAAVDTALQRLAAGDQVELTLRSDAGVRSLMLRLGRHPQAGRTPAGDQPALVESMPREASTSPRAERDGEVADAAASVDAPAASFALPFGTDFDKARDEARSGSKPLLVLYGAGWNEGSKAQRKVLLDARVQQLLPGLVTVYIDAERNRELLIERGIEELPAVEVMVGEATWVRRGFVPAEELIGMLGRAKSARSRPGSGDAGHAARSRERAEAGDAASDAAPARDELERELEALRREIRSVQELLQALRRARGGN